MNWGLRIGLVALLLVFALGGCNRDDAFVGVPGDPGNGSDNGDNGDNGDDGDPPPPPVDSLLLLVDPPTLASSAIDNDDGVTLTAIARSASNVVIPGVTLDFGADSGALAVTNAVTNANGRASAVLTTGGDPRNRTITVDVASGDVTRSITVDVAGTQLQVGGPASIESGVTETFSVNLRDAAGDGIRDVAVSASSANGNVITPATADTDVNGLVTFAVEGNQGGTDTLTFEGLDMTVERTVLVSPFGIEFLSPDAGIEADLGTTVDIEVVLREDGDPLAGEDLKFSATRGTLSDLVVTTDAEGHASVTLDSTGANGAGPVLVTAHGPDDVMRKHAFEFVATVPATITTQVEPATVAPGGEAEITAIVRDADSNPVKNQVVRFSLDDLSGGQLESSTAITDIQGVARTNYIASSASSASDGVVITAEIGDPLIASDDATLTVSAPAVFIVLGTDNRIQKHDEDATYSKVFNALILDSAGNPPPPGTQFRLSLRSLEYQKGVITRAAPGDPWELVYQIDDTDPFYGGLNVYFGQGPFGCRSEDPQGTGNINLADDYNNNDQIDPANVALVPGTAEVSEDGVAAFTLRWPQNYALWVLARLKATAVVAGTESTRRLDFVLQMDASDISPSETPPNLVSPFGVAADCTDPT